MWQLLAENYPQTHVYHQITLQICQSSVIVHECQHLDKNIVHPKHFITEQCQKVPFEWKGLAVIASVNHNADVKIRCRKSHYINLGSNEITCINGTFRALHSPLCFKQGMSNFQNPVEQRNAILIQQFIWSFNFFESFHFESEGKADLVILDLITLDLIIFD